MTGRNTASRRQRFSPVGKADSLNAPFFALAGVAGASLLAAVVLAASASGKRRERRAWLIDRTTL